MTKWTGTGEIGMALSGGGTRAVGFHLGTTAAAHFQSLLAIATPGTFYFLGEIPDEMKALYKEAFQIDPIVALRVTAARGKWIDQSQSHNVFMTGTSGKKLSETYLQAWKMGLKTTYYLRTLAASNIEKATIASRKLEEPATPNGAAPSEKTYTEAEQQA